MWEKIAIPVFAFFLVLAMTIQINTVEAVYSDCEREVDNDDSITHAEKTVQKRNCDTYGNRYGKAVDFLIHTDEVNGFKIKYFSSWEIVDLDDLLINVMFLSPLESAYDDFAENVLVIREQLFFKTSLDDYTKLNLAQLKTPNFQLLESTKTTLGGLPATRIVYSDKDETGLETKQMMVWTVSDKHAYIVAYTAMPETYSSHISTVQKMIGSFEIIGIKQEELDLSAFNEFVTYQDPVKGYKLEYPKGWTEIKLDMPTVDLTIVSPLENNFDSFTENFVIGTLSVPFQNLNDYSRITVEKMKMRPSFSLIEDIETTLAGIPAHKIVYTEIEPNFNIEVQSIMLWTLKDNTGYLIGFVTEPDKYSAYLPIAQKVIDSFEFTAQSTKEIETQGSATPSAPIPDWIKNNAKWWAEGQIGDSDFTSGIQYMIKENIMVIPDLPESDTGVELKDEKRAMGLEREKVPDWVKNNAGWWADGLISEEDFLNGIKYLVEKGIIRV